MEWLPFLKLYCSDPPTPPHPRENFYVLQQNYYNPFHREEDKQLNSGVLIFAFILLFSFWAWPPGCHGDQLFANIVKRELLEHPTHL